MAGTTIEEIVENFVMDKVEAMSNSVTGLAPHIFVVWGVGPIGNDKDYNECFAQRIQQLLVTIFHTILVLKKIDPLVMINDFIQCHLRKMFGCESRTCGFGGGVDQKCVSNGSGLLKQGFSGRKLKVCQAIVRACVIMHPDWHQCHHPVYACRCRHGAWCVCVCVCVCVCHGPAAAPPRTCHSPQ
jgi:hypothetical protein